MSPGGRVCGLESTERRWRALLERVPITRVYDAAPLDHLGLPVWAAVTPLARDLTVHAGKGVSAEAARTSAVMEAIERVSAEAVAPERVRRGSYWGLRGRAAVADPERFDLPYETCWAPDREFSWVLAEDLVSATPVWVPLDLAISPAREGLCLGPETNGLAAGNVAREAILHGLYEVIERDAVAHERFRRRYGAALPRRLVDLDSLPEPAASWVAHLHRARLSVRVRELTHDLGVPVFGAVLEDADFPGREGRAVRFAGFGADLDPGNAVMRALSEAVQSHTAVLVGARESFEEGPARAAGAGTLVDWLRAGASTVGFQSATDVPVGLEARLAEVLNRLVAAGLTSCVAVDLTRPDLGVPVVRVLVPGTAAPYGESARRPPARLLRTLL